MWSRLRVRSLPPSFVAIGGGTGLSTMLRGLKQHTDRITAIVSVGDDGGSSGRLRKEFGIIPPGDIRNCLAALAEAPPTLEALFQYRFPGSSELSGHAFGNLFLAALTEITGDVRLALKEATRILAVRGQVLPASEEKVSLVATHADGTKTTGEVEVVKARRPIERLELKPTPGPIAEDLFRALKDADLIVLGPGSLYTSVLPPLIVPGMAEAVAASPAPVVYVCNIMTQPGETDGFGAADHVRVLESHTQAGLVDHVLVNNAKLTRVALATYSENEQTPVAVESKEDWPHRAVLHRRPLAAAGDTIRHDPGALARVLLSLLKPRRLRNRTARASANRNGHKREP